MQTSKFNAVEELQNDIQRGVPADDYTQSINGKEILHIKFQTGGTATNEKNGIFIEELLNIAYIKLKSYNDQFPCRENSLALTKIEEANHWLYARKVERESRGVYGKEEK